MNARVSLLIVFKPSDAPMASDPPAVLARVIVTANSEYSDVTDTSRPALSVAEAATYA
jgi:hypothetical protein